MCNKEGMYPRHHIKSSRLKNANPQADTWFAETEVFECTLK